MIIGDLNAKVQSVNVRIMYWTSNVGFVQRYRLGNWQQNSISSLQK